MAQKEGNSFQSGKCTATGFMLLMAPYISVMKLSLSVGCPERG